MADDLTETIAALRRHYPRPSVPNFGTCPDGVGTATHQVLDALQAVTAERDRLAALVECATEFHLKDQQATLAYRSRFDGTWGWILILPSAEVSDVATWHPTREAAFAAYEAVRAKEAAE